MVAAAPARTGLEASPVRAWAAYAAIAWAALFAVQSLASAIGASAGSDTGADLFAAGFARLARDRDPGLITLLWIAVLAKVGAAAVALAQVRAWGDRRRRGLLRWLDRLIGGGALLYGLANAVQSIAMRAGVVDVPASLGRRALSWHLWLWNPYWIAGGVLFLAIPRRRARRQDGADRP